MGIAMLLESIASAMPERPLVGARADALSAGDLLELAGGATVLRDSGADAVGFIGTGGPAFPVSLFSAAMTGVPFTPLNYRLARAELTELAAGHGQRSRSSTSIRGRFKGEPVTDRSPPASAGRGAGWPSPIARANSTTRRRRGRCCSPAGTTGEPKAVGAAPRQPDLLRALRPSSSSAATRTRQRWSACRRTTSRHRAPC